MNKTKNNKPTRLSTIFKNGPLLAVVVTAILITVLNSYFQFLSFQESSKKMESEYNASQKELIKKEVLKVTDYIEHKRSQVNDKVKQRIKSRVYEAHAIATNIYKQFKGELSDKKIKKLIVEALRPLRFFNGNGYYYINSIDGVSQLHPLLPHIEGLNRIESKLTTGRYLVKEMRNLISKSGEGFISYIYRSFKDKNKEKPKVAYVKKFEPYDWYIGSGDYVESVEKEMQKEILDYIGKIRFGENSYIFVVDYKGNVLMNASQKHLIGNNIWHLKDPNGVMVVQEERKAVENPEGDFIHYVWNKPSTASPSPKTSFMKGVKDWQWMIGAGIYLDDLQVAIQQQRTELKYNHAKQVVIIIFISFLIGLSITYAASKVSGKFSNELGFFLDFFKNLTVNAEKINVNSLRYTEFRDLAASANRMLDKQIEIENKRSSTEKSLRVSEANLQEAQRITHYGSWEYNVLTGELYWSDEVYRILELDPGTNNPTYELFINSTHPDDRELVDTTYKNSVANRKPYDIEHRIKLADGKVKRVREHIEMVYDQNGKTIRSRGTIQDVTDIREKEELLKRSQKMDALGKLTGGIAHDYNNMLGVILGYSDILLEHADISPQNIKYVTQIRDAGERAKSLTSKLMAFTRYTPSHLEVMDINSEILSHQQLLEKTLTARIKLSLDLEKDVWPVELDKGDFIDAIVNMAINASHAIDANGNVTIITRNLIIDNYEANILNLDAGEYVSFSISDTGYGMDSQTIGQIFDPFFTTKGDKGTGLGLSQVYGFVKRSGGNISVESELGAGTEFVFYFPRYDADIISSENEAAGNAVKKGNETILVVDDEISLCSVAKEILSSHGYRVLTATSATQALIVLKIEKIDLLFSDVIMPGISGYELADEVKNKYPDVIIQLASGFNEAMNMTNNVNIANMKILQKPYTSSELLIRIRELLDAKRSSV